MTQGQQQHKDDEPKLPPITDINNPPKLPYHFEDYPRVLYKGTENVTVQDAAEEKKHASQGWRREPPSAEGAAEAEEKAEPKKK